ncbi:MAG: 4a-hydroxytetrahydrobiopterin dehydratase [Agarilytica sp.]
MTELSSGQCEPCRVGAPTLTDNELAELSSQVPDWSVINVDGVKQVSRQYTFSNFVTAMAFANKVGELAEQEGHHPALLVEWGKTTVTWWTHKIKGLHRNDIIMAAKTDELLPE